MNGKVIINRRAFEYDNAIINRIIRRAIKEVGGNKYDVEMKHIKEVISLKDMKTNKKIDLPKWDICTKYIWGYIYKDLRQKRTKRNMRN